MLVFSWLLNMSLFSPVGACVLPISTHFLSWWRTWTGTEESRKNHPRLFSCPCSIQNLKKYWWRCAVINLPNSGVVLITHFSYHFQQVHNRNLLSLDFDRVTRTEKINDDHRKFTLRILYDQAGRPSLWSPSSGLNGVNVTYSPGGHVAGIQRGTMSERMEYDQTGRITSRTFADGKSWTYTYLEKVWSTSDMRITV